MQLEADNKVGPYTVVRRLGQGGMSNVYLANDELNNREVVLKFPHEELLGDVSSHERFNREVKIGKLLDSDHIQRLYELADEKGAPYLVLGIRPGRTPCGTCCATGSISTVPKTFRRRWI